MEEIKILYIDDEVNNLLGFKATLRKEYQIFTASNEAVAFRVLEEHPDLRIIFSDQRMPGRSGTALFEEIRERYPLPVRILLTAYTEDLNTVVDAINKGNVYRYARKPWILEDIRTIISEANKHYLTNSLLAIKNRELEEAYKELDKFAFSVSHDIRGPLAGIMAAAQLALEVQDKNEISDILTIISRSADRLDRYTLNLHDHYSIRRGALNINEINFTELHSDLSTFFQTMANSKQVRFEIEQSVDEPFLSDEVSLKLVLTNLLSNAFKYQRMDNPNRFVRLTTSMSKGIATFVIEDSGIGIKEQYISQIFNLFFRASSLESGSGIGLYNVKNVLLKLGGEVTVNSKLGEGSVFRVQIPTK